MSDGGPQLAFLARLAEATRWDDAVRRHEDDPWGYLRRKLESTGPPLKAYKQHLYDAAKAKLFADLEQPLLPPRSVEAHKEVFELLMTPGDFVDLAINLQPGVDRKLRLDMSRMVLHGAVALTLFDMEALPPEQRGKLWQNRVAELSNRLRIDVLSKVADRNQPTPRVKAMLARRLRRNLDEFLSVTRHENGLRDELTPFVLVRVEAAIAACLRFLARWK